MKNYQFGWFSTGRDKAARELLMVAHDSIYRGELKAEIPFVFCNREPGESQQSDLFLKLVENYQIPLRYFSFKKFVIQKSATSISDCRLEYDREVMQRLKGFQPDLSVLAGYMLIVGKEMCRRYSMINLHPAVPRGPTGSWQEVIWQLIENQDNKTGVMMHLATPGLDKGPPVTYCTFSIRGKPFDKYWQEIEGYSLEEIKRREGGNNPLFKEIRKHGLAREFPLIIATLKAFSQMKVKIIGTSVMDVTRGEVISGYDLTEEINSAVKEKLEREADE